MRELAHFPLNPSYGFGAFRRKLVFTAVTGGMVARVDDAFHSYWLVLDTDAKEITGIDAGFLRAPTDVCPGALLGLRALIGMPLGAATTELMMRLPQSGNCTHLGDLAMWTIAQAGNSATWDIEVPDRSGDASVWITISRDGASAHRWGVSEFEMTSPEQFSGKPLRRGFMKWAAAAFKGDELMAATMLQRGLFVARGRQHIVDQGSPMPLSRAEGMAGMCWAYSEDRLANGRGNIGYVRDFTEAVRPETLPQHVRERLREAGS